MEHSYTTDFELALAAGKLNEAVIAHEFVYNGIPLVQTVGRNDVDFFLQDGRSLEVKLDLRSQCTGSGIIEYPTLQRGADFYLHTFTSCRVFTREQYQRAYMTGKIATGVGQFGYDARLIRNLQREGLPLWLFLKNLKTL